MFFLVYASSATQLFTQAELLALLQHSREKNSAVGITGLLLYKDGNFMQVLEGEEAAVRSTFEKIRWDPRHRGVMVLLEGEEAGRQFEYWSMGFQNLNSAGTQATPGYSEFLNTSLTSDEFIHDPTRSQRLLLTFRRIMR